jgi:hypothetical protein
MKKFLNDPLSNGVVIVALVLAAVFGAWIGAPNNDVTGLALTGGASNFSLLQTADGTVSEPSHAFTNDTDSGLYRIGANNLGVAAGGSKILDVGAAGVSVSGILTVSTLVSQSVGASAAYITATTALSTASLTVPGAVTFSGNATSTGNLQAVNITATTALSTAALTTGGAATIGTFLKLTAATAISVTNGAAFTPTASYQPLTSAGTVTPTIATSGVSTGTVLRLVNTSATSIVIQDTGTQVLGGDRTLGQNDVLLLLFDGTNWLEMAYANN